jgi:hypothetical protein
MSSLTLGIAFFSIWVRGTYLFKPVALKLFEAVLLGHVVDEHDSLRALVIGTGDGAEAFLSCRVPYLKLDGAVGDWDGPT